MPDPKMDVPLLAYSGSSEERYMESVDYVSIN